jgi:drug/metabolite transporter (DMT)-like permease
MNVAQQRSMTGYEWAMLLALSVLWGGSFFFNGVAVRELPPLTVVFCRVALAAFILAIVIRALGQRLPLERKTWAAFVWMGLLNNVIPFSLIVWGQSHIASGVASILNATTPLFTIVLGHWLTADEKMTTSRLLGVIIGMVGVAVMIGVGALKTVRFDVVAQFACLLGALSYAFAAIYGRRFRAMGVSPLATAMGQVTTSTVMLLPIVLMVDKPWTLPVPSAAAIAALVCVAALSTAAGYILYFRILSTAGAANLALVTFLIPISAILLGVLVLAEVLHPKHFLGMAMIGVGLATIDGRLWDMANRVFLRGQYSIDHDLAE